MSRIPVMWYQANRNAIAMGVVASFPGGRILAGGSSSITILDIFVWSIAPSRSIFSMARAVEGIWKM